MKFKRLEATIGFRVGLHGSTKVWWGSWPGVFREVFTGKPDSLSSSNIWPISASVIILVQNFLGLESWGRSKRKSKWGLFLSLDSSGQPPTDYSYSFCQMVFLFHLPKIYFRKKERNSIQKGVLFSHGKEHSVVLGDWMKFCQWVHSCKTLKFSQTY